MGNSFIASEQTESLNRFLTKQNGIYEAVIRELTIGKKLSHWMWYIFPQLRVLGKSQTSFIYGISDIFEAKAYLEHPVLGKRLKECCEIFLTHKDKSAEEIFGEIDAMKLRSSMTLFAYVSEDNSVFHKVLATFFDGEKDKITLSLLNKY